MQFPEYTLHLTSFAEENQNYIERKVWNFEWISTWNETKIKVDQMDSVEIPSENGMWTGVWACERLNKNPNMSSLSSHNSPVFFNYHFSFLNWGMFENGLKHHFVIFFSDIYLFLVYCISSYMCFLCVQLLFMNII